MISKAKLAALNTDNYKEFIKDYSCAYCQYSKSKNWSVAWTYWYNSLGVTDDHATHVKSPTKAQLDKQLSFTKHPRSPVNKQYSTKKLNKLQIYFNLMKLFILRKLDLI